MNKIVKISFYFPMLRQTVKFLLKKLIPLDEYEAIFLITLNAIKNKTVFITVNDLFKTVLNTKNNEIIRHFWLDLIRKFASKNIIYSSITNIKIQNMEDVDLLELDVNAININQKIKDFIDNDEFFSMDEENREEKEDFDLKHNQLSIENYKKYLNDAKALDEYIEIQDANIDKYDERELNSKITKAERELTRKKNYISISEEIKKEIIRLVPYELNYDLKLDIEHNKDNLKLILRTDNSFSQKYFFEDFFKNNWTNKYNNNIEKIFKQIFVNEDFFNKIYSATKIENNEKSVKNIENSLEILFDKHPINEILINNENYLVIRHKLWKLTKFNAIIQIENNLLNDKEIDFNLPVEISEDEYSLIIKYIYKTPFSEKNNFLSIDLENHVKNFIDNTFFDKNKINVEELLNIAILLKQTVQHPLDVFYSIFDDSTLFEKFNKLSNEQDYDYFIELTKILGEKNIIENLLDYIDLDNLNYKVFNIIKSTISDSIHNKIIDKFIKENIIENLINNNEFKNTYFAKRSFESLNQFDKLKKEIELILKTNKDVKEIDFKLKQIKNIKLFNKLNAFEYILEIKDFLIKTTENLLKIKNFLKNEIKNEILSVRESFEKIAKKKANSNNANIDYSKTLESISKNHKEAYKYLSELIHKQSNISKLNLNQLINIKEKLENYKKLLENK